MIAPVSMLMLPDFGGCCAPAAVQKVATERTATKILSALCMTPPFHNVNLQRPVTVAHPARGPFTFSAQIQTTKAQQTSSAERRSRRVRCSDVWCRTRVLQTRPRDQVGHTKR